MIIDTDPGIDDILAILYADLAGLPIRALTTVHGNASVQDVTRNALFLAEQLQSRPKVYQGQAVALNGAAYTAESSGGNGLGGYVVHPGDELLGDITAYEYLRQELLGAKAAGTQIDLLCLGPLSNIAKLVQQSPDLLSVFGKVVIMGGAFNGKGNITPLAEFNVFCDPEAFGIVVSNLADRRIETVIIPAEVCRTVLLEPQDLQELETQNVLPHISEIIKPYIDYYMHNPEYGGYRGAVIYDLLVPFFITHPELFQLEKSEVHVQTEQGEEFARTTRVPDESSSVRVCTSVDGAAVKNIFMNHFKSSK